MRLKKEGTPSRKISQRKKRIRRNYIEKEKVEQKRDNSKEPEAIANSVFIYLEKLKVGY